MSRIKRYLKSSAATTIKWLRQPLMLVLLILAIVWLWQKTNWLPNPRDWFASQPVVIESTPLIVSQIRPIAELHTAQWIAEVVVDSTVITQDQANQRLLRDALLAPWVPPQGGWFARQLVLVVKGTVRAGINLAHWHADSVKIAGDTIRVRLPAPQILDIIVNPTDIEVFSEEGHWQPNDVLAVKQKALTALKLGAQEKQLPDRAGRLAAEAIQSFLEACGFKTVIVSFSQK